jgi:hypothetical protein
MDTFVPLYFPAMASSSALPLVAGSALSDAAGSLTDADGDGDGSLELAAGLLLLFFPHAASKMANTRINDAKIVLVLLSCFNRFSPFGKLILPYSGVYAHF